MTAPIAEQPEDVRARPAALTILVVILGIAVSAVIVWLLLPTRPTHDATAPSVPTHQPFDGASALEQHRAAEARAIDAWLPAEIDRYLEAHR